MSNPNNIDKSYLEKRVAELEGQVRNLEKDLIHDALTSLKTRTFFEEEVSVYLKAIAHNKEGKRKEWFGFKNIGIIFLDIDNFKKINDRYGHHIGDIVLERVSAVIKDSLRTGDTSARWGGEEIVVSLLGANEKDALAKAEDIRSKVEEINFSEVPDLRVTISGGVTSSEKAYSLSELIEQADQALYKAKKSGRNKVIAYSKFTLDKNVFHQH